MDVQFIQCLLSLSKLPILVIFEFLTLACTLFLFSEDHYNFFKFNLFPLYITPPFQLLSLSVNVSLPH